MNTYRLTAPLTRQAVSQLRIGDYVLLSGYIYTARDAAHKRIMETLAAGGKPPVDLTDSTIFYAGPCPARPGRVIGSIASTTATRIDGFVEMMFQQGMTAMIGKGERAPHVAESCKKHGGVYLLGVGGASALISDCVKSLEVVAYDDLGTESIKRLYVEDMKLIVGIDSNGDDFYARERAIYAR